MLHQRVLLADNNAVGYLVDLDIEHLLRKKRVWTRDDGTLMLRVVSLYRTEPEDIPLAQFVWETMMMQELPRNAELQFKDGNRRNLAMSNLDAVPKRAERSA